MSEKWLQKASEKMHEHGTEEGLTNAAHRAQFPSALAFAHHIMAHRKDYSPERVKQANFAVNANK